MKLENMAMLMGAGLLWLAVSGCDSNQAVSTTETTKPGAAGQTTVTEGAVHKPPIQKAEVPDGHYYCDMGTAHYSRAAQGDGKCPLCNMNLTKK